MSTATQLLESLADQTWIRIRDGYELDISQGEETITDFNLLEIKRSGVRSIQVLKVSKAVEAIRGIDWEWWIGSNAQGWLRYAMQAKKIQVTSQRYDSLSHKVNGVPQIDLLETYARKVTAIPLYCLYNYPKNAVSTRHWHCSFPYDEKQLGCTVTPSFTIRQAMNAKGCRNFNFIHSQTDTIPWRCLLNCPQILRLYTGAPSNINFENVRLYSRLPTDILRVTENKSPLSPESYPVIKIGELGDINPSDVSHLTGNNEIRVVPRKVLIINIGDEFE